MKRIFLFLTVAVCMLFGCILFFPRETVRVEDFKYEIDAVSNTVTITGYDGSGGNVIVPDTIDGRNVDSIGKDAFFNCNSLTSIRLSDRITNIGMDTFCSCDNLTKIQVDSRNEMYSSENGLLYNKDKTLFIRCPEGKEGTIHLPDEVTEIGDYAFCFCDSLTSIQLPDGVTEIGNYAFCFCSNLTSIQLPDGVTRIGDSVFSECYRLTGIRIPDSVASIGWRVFYGCDSLTEIQVDSGNEIYSSENGLLYNKDKTALIRCPEGKEGTLHLSDGVTGIEDSAFSYCGSLTSIHLPNSVKTMGDSVFDNCTNLTDIYYSGTKQQWEKMKIGSYNDALKNISIHYESPEKNTV